jgi:glycosyltransferase involved in cell wall biosynthesis
MVEKSGANILQLVDTLGSGGTEKMVVNISNALYSGNHNVIICGTRKLGSYLDFINSNINCVSLNKKSFFDIIAFIKLLKLIKLYKIEILHAHSSSIIWGAIAKLFFPRLKLLWHDHLGSREKDFYRNKFYILISPLINGIISVNENLQLWAKENSFVSPEKIIVINNFVDSDSILNNNEQFYSNKIVYLANLMKPKDHHTLIYAINHALKVNPKLNFELLLIGMDNNDQYSNSLKNIIENFGLEKIVKLLGRVENPESILSKSFIGVISSTSEGLPVSLLEYGQHSLVVLATQVGHCPKVLNNGEFGVLVPPMDYIKMGESICEIFNNRSYFIRKAELFNAHIKNEYSSKSFLLKYNHFIFNI